MRDFMNSAMVRTPEDFGGGPHESARQNTKAIQFALDTLPIGSRLFLPHMYPVTGGGDFVLELRRNVSIAGLGQHSGLRGDGCSDSTDLIGICFDENGGNLDVRQWSMQGARVFFNGGGRDAVHLYDGFVVNNSKISDCILNGNLANGGRAFRVSHDKNWAHSEFERNLCAAPVQAMCGDANVFRKNTISSPEDQAFIVNTAHGVRNNTICDNTLVSRDGAVHIINGDQWRIENNQIEQYPGFGENQSDPSASIWLEGRDRPVVGASITKNNFGGVTNVDHSIYVDNARDCVIKGANLFVATNGHDIVLTAQSRDNIVGFDNHYTGTVSNPRTDAFFGMDISDAAGRNINTPWALAGQNNASANVVYRGEDGTIHFMMPVDGGVTAKHAVLYTLPPLMRNARSPLVRLSTVDYAGSPVALEVVGTNGSVRYAAAAPSSAGISIPATYRAIPEVA